MWHARIMELNIYSVRGTALHNSLDLHDLQNVSAWLSANKLTLNKTKTEYNMIIGSNKGFKQIDQEPHNIRGSRIDRVKKQNHLG